MKKFNKYLRHYLLDDVHVLFNLANERLIALSDELYEAIADSTSDIDRIEAIHPALFRQLVEAEMVVDHSVDETKSVIDRWVDEDNNPTEVKLTVNPTLQCNLNCWYCYEDHTGRSSMSDDTIESIKRLIERTLAIAGVKKLQLSFFGGEPLLYFNQTVKPLVSHAYETAKKADKRIGISFTSNGVLLSNAVCTFLSQFNIPISFQITLDGGEEVHDRTRFLKGGQPTYHIIVNNIRRAIQKGIDVSIRFNYTAENYESFESVPSEFDSLSPDEKKHISFDFHKVWQEQPNDTISRKMSSLNENFLIRGFNSENFMPGFGTERCYAEKAHNVVVNHNGLIYQCTARDFVPEAADGHLNADGTIQWNDRHNQRLRMKLGSPVCHNCGIFPICHNGCSQDKMEQETIIGCPRGYSEGMKELLAKDKASYILKKHIIRQH